MLTIFSFFRPLLKLHRRLGNKDLLLLVPHHDLDHHNNHSSYHEI